MKPHNDTFIFQGYDTSLKKGKVLFHYRIVLKGQEISFRETLSFPPISHQISAGLLTPVLNNLLLILGISYWKLYCLKNIEIIPFTLSKEQAVFWNTVYTKGLGEFFYKNKIDYHGLVSFPFVEKNAEKAISISPQNRSLLLVGGGKDSLVSAELLKKYRKQFSAFTINPKPIHENTIECIGSDKIFFTRTIDPKLLELNKQKDTYNGHIPASAQYALIGLLAAVLFDYQYVIASNERSANYGNVMYLGEEINHQWSKSEEFEKLFQNYVATHITPDIIYFSLLRPLSEIKIAKIFSQYPQYFSTFSSCNTNFRITGEKNTKLWCGECPKCCFVFTMLAAFLSKEKVINIFGKNLFEDVSLLPLFRELLGLGKIKPFECVGTPQEMQYAMYCIYKKGGFAHPAIMQMFAEEAMISEAEAEILKKELFAIQKNNLPAEFKNIL